MNKKYVVTLTGAERRSLRGLVSTGKGAARKLAHARILLQTDSGDGGAGWSDERICEGLGVGVSTVERVRKRFVEEGLEELTLPPDFGWSQPDFPPPWLLRPQLGQQVGIGAVRLRQTTGSAPGSHFATTGQAGI